jgi:hypothetical protein
MYTDKFAWDSVRDYQLKLTSGSSNGGQSSPKQQQRRGGISETIASIVQDSGVLDIKKEVEEISASTGLSSVRFL